MNWSDQIKFALPARLKDEGNALWHVLDPDMGGRLTWEGEATHSQTGDEPATHLLIVTPLPVETYDVLASGDPYEVMQHASDLAEERSRDLPDWDADTWEEVVQEIDIKTDVRRVSSLPA